MECRDCGHRPLCPLSFVSCQVNHAQVSSRGTKETKKQRGQLNNRVAGTRLPRATKACDAQPIAIALTQTAKAKKNFKSPMSVVSLHQRTETETAHLIILQVFLKSVGRRCRWGISFSQVVAISRREKKGGSSRVRASGWPRRAPLFGVSSGFWVLGFRFRMGFWGFVCYAHMIQTTIRSGILRRHPLL